MKKKPTKNTDGIKVPGSSSAEEPRLSDVFASQDKKNAAPIPWHASHGWCEGIITRSRSCVFLFVTVEMSWFDSHS